MTGRCEIASSDPNINFLGKELVNLFDDRSGTL